MNLNFITFTGRKRKETLVFYRQISSGFRNVCVADVKPVILSSLGTFVEFLKHFYDFEPLWGDFVCVLNNGKQMFK